MSAASRFGDEEFVRLTTFKRDGTGVGTTVWCVADGADLLVTTMDSTGKIKRLRHTSRILLVPSSRTGSVSEGAVPVEGTATVFDDEPGLVRLQQLLTGKYGLQARALFAVRKVTGRDSHRVGIRVSVP